MTPGKDQIVLHASEGFKDALGEYATTNNLSMSETIRRAVAAMIGYDLAGEPARMRTPKYDTPELAKRAALDRAALKRWGMATSSKLLLAGELEAAMLIARAVNENDYESLAALKDPEEEATDEAE